MGQIIGRLTRLDGGDGLGQQLLLFLLGDQLELRHAPDDQVASHFDLGRFAPRIIAVRGLGYPGQQHAFGMGQLLRGLVEIEPGRLGDAPGAVAVIDFVEIHFQDLFFAVLAFEVHGHAGFGQFPVDGFFPGKVFVLDQLLSDGRAPFGHGALHHVLDQSPGDALDVDAAVFEIASIFNGNQGILQELGDAVDGHPVAAFRRNPAHIAAFTVEDLDGGVACRQGRMGGELFLGESGTGQADDQAGRNNGTTKQFLPECCGCHRMTSSFMREILDGPTPFR
jgi:hypothetical protein